MPEPHKYKLALDQLAFAHGKPGISGRIKAKASDFVVTEVMGFEPTGNGEHHWLDISKTKLSTERVAKALARYAGVAFRDVGYSGMKDVHAVTRQWFSVWLPKKPDLDWTGFSMDGATVHAVSQHSRKLKRGAHRGNQFEIRIRDLLGCLDDLEQRIERVKRCGVPNYFGIQRFGHEANNLPKAEHLFINKQRMKDRNLRSVLLSSARSFLFNKVVSERVEQGSWCTLMPYEPAALDGGNSVFASNNEVDNPARLAQLDIHPTAPLWGRGASVATELFAELAEWEQHHIDSEPVLARGLEENGLEYQRRSLRSAVKDFTHEFVGDDVVVKFTLQTGQFATSVLRELVCEDSPTDLPVDANQTHNIKLNGLHG